MTRITACIGSRPLTARQRAFALDFARNGKPAYQAALRAGYPASNAARAACRLLKQSAVWAAIDAEVEAIKAAERRACEREERKQQAAYAAEQRARVELALNNIRTKGVAGARVSVEHALGLR